MGLLTGLGLLAIGFGDAILLAPDSMNESRIEPPAPPSAWACSAWTTSAKEMKDSRLTSAESSAAYVDAVSEFAVSASGGGI